MPVKCSRLRQQIRQPYLEYVANVGLDGEAEGSINDESGSMTSLIGETKQLMQRREPHRVP